MTNTDYNGFYKGMVIYDVAKVVDAGSKYRVEYCTQSTIAWSETHTDNLNTQYLPLNSTTADIIRENQRKGKEVYIKKEWSKMANEVLITDIEINPVSDLFTYKRRANGFIKSFINPLMASAHASVIYGFTTLNNKFIERGFVFSEEHRSLKYIEIMDRSEEISETEPELSEELMLDLEKYIDYREILDRTNFIWNESEKYISKIEDVSILKTFESSEHEQECNLKAKSRVDELVTEFQNKINTLNNLK